MPRAGRHMGALVVADTSLAPLLDLVPLSEPFGAGPRYVSKQKQGREFLAKTRAKPLSRAIHANGSERGTWSKRGARLLASRPRVRCGDYQDTRQL
eukprot:5577769-Prymnesium_polylepis.1